MKQKAKYIQCIVVSIFIVSVSIAQTHSIDSLQGILKTQQDDTNKVNTLNALCEKLWRADKYDNSLVIATSCQALAEKLNYKKGLAFAFKNMGAIYIGKANYSKALECTNNSLSIFREIGNKEGVSRDLNNIGNIYDKLGKDSLSLACYLKSLAISQEIGDGSLSSLVLINVESSYEKQNNYPKEIEYLTKSLAINQELGNKNNIGDNLTIIGNAYRMEGNYSKALEYDTKALKIAEEIGNKQLVAKNLGNIGVVSREQGDYPNALENFQKALTIAEETGNKQLQAGIFVNLGGFYEDQNDSSKALDYYRKALTITEQMGLKNGQATVLGNIGNIYREQVNYPKALEYDMRALKLAEETGYKQGQASILCNIGLLFAYQGGYQKAIEYDMRALGVAKEIGNRQIEATAMGLIGSLYKRTGKFKEAEEYLKKAIALDSLLGEQNYLRVFEESISQLYDTTGRYKYALEYYKKSMVLKDTLFSIDKNKALTRKEMTYEFEKKQAAEKAEQDKKDARQRILVWSIISGLLLVLIFSGFIFRSLRITKKQKDLIGKQKQIVEEQKQIVEEKNKDILDSITYAKRLQDAILPPLSLVNHYLPESFLFYKPKDIVAGDFYWMERSSDNILIAAADCTGHGVPGALVSVVCSNALNRTVKEFKITNTGKILDKVRELVLETFEKSEGNIQDGMDISLCCINTKTNEAQWSGAYNSLWYVRNGEVFEVPADKQPIGKVDKPMPFNTHNLSLLKGDTLYLFTDGYADQFGGPKGKKFKYKQMQELLLANATKPMEEQKAKLEHALNEWKGNLEQVDDVLIIGIRV